VVLQNSVGEMYGKEKERWDNYISKFDIQD